tara:strand:+ start:1472 stop:2422 length:951 start_codon:yes stop_codon:yes gene_type:complete
MNFYCPNCLLNDLESELSSDNEEKLLCQLCSSHYPIINEIPRLTGLSNYSDSFGYQWNIFGKTQLDSYTKKTISEDRVKKAMGLGNLQDIKGNLLEAGSGAGRFTEVLVKTSANIISFDFSNAVEANYINNSEAKNLKIFQGDIYSIPFKNKSFEHVFCLGVIQHTPNSEKAFKSLASKVKKGGYLYIDHYALKWHHIFQWKYLLRPLTKRIPKRILLRMISFLVPFFIPIAKLLKSLFGRYAIRILPVVEYSHLDLDPEINKQWAILDTFDMYSPEHDHPKSIKTIQKWFDEINFVNVEVFYGDNGIVARGRRPL